MIRAVIFDLGNTLMYFDGDWDEVTAGGVEGLTRYLVANGILVGDDFGDDLLRIRGLGRELSARTDVEFTATQALRAALSQHGYADTAEEIVTRGLELFFEPEEEHWVAYTDAQPTLAQLRAGGLHVGLISNATDDGFIQRITQRAGLHRYFDPVISSAAMPWRKPDPRIFKHVLDRWNLGPQETVMVGDWPSTDILGAHRAHMPAILIDDRWPEPPHLHADIPDKHLLGADAVIRQLGDLIPAMERLDHQDPRPQTPPHEGRGGTGTA